MTTGEFAPAAILSPTYMHHLREAGALCRMGRGDSLSHEGERPSHVLVLAVGYAVAVKRLAGGQQQNVALYVPGDIVDHESFTLGRSRCSTVALTDVTFYKVAHASLRTLHEGGGEAADAFWRYVAFSGALAHEWLLSLGRRSAYARTAHLLCEIIHRTDGLDRETFTCSLPLTQAELADTLGLSVVHVNRTLMRLRQEGLIRLRRVNIDILSWSRFKAAAGFDPSYLQHAA